MLSQTISPLTDGHINNLLLQTARRQQGAVLAHLLNNIIWFLFFLSQKLRVTTTTSI